MEALVYILFFIIFILIFKKQHDRFLEKRTTLIDNYRFPSKVLEQVQSIYPHLKQSDMQLVIQGLRDYFHISNMAGKKMVAMPSQVVDVAWHEFILFTREYKAFCEDALGRFLHHTPAEAMKDKTEANKGIKLAWNFACIKENMFTSKASSLPLLFAIDNLLEIPDGFKYSLDCTKDKSGNYCAGHIGCGGSSCSGSSGDSSSGCGGGCGGS